MRTSKLKRENRDSNIELLRITCIFFIVFHHFMVHGLGIAGYSGADIDRFGLINSFVIVGVNCFILISGYFGIRATVKGFIRLYLFCFFYSFFIEIINIIILDGYTIKGVIKSFLPFSQGLWFINAYICLYLLSPILNKALGGLRKDDYLVFLLLTSFLTFYFGFLMKGRINTDGYNVMNFTFLYLIGRFISINIKINKNKKTLIVYGVIYIVSSVILSVTALIVKMLDIETDIDMFMSYIYAYNNPLVILSSVAIFMFFMNINFKNRIINWAASSVLAVYLIHENKTIQDFIYENIFILGSNISNDIILFIILIILDLTLILVCIFIDKIRILIVSPIEKIFDNIPITEYLNQNINKISKYIR